MRIMKVILTLLIIVAINSPVLVRPEEKELLIGLIPEQNIFKQFERYLPLAKYIEKRTGIKIRLTILSRYGDIVDRFTQRRMDGAFFGDLTGALAIRKLSVIPLVKPVREDGSTSVHGCIIVRKDSGIRSVAGMKDKVMAFVDRATVTGYLFPIVYLREHGVREIDSFFSEHYFSGSFDASVYAVLDGRADVGCVKDSIFRNLVKKDPSIKDELEIIAVSPAMPESTLCVKDDLPENMKKMLREVLLNMNRDAEGRKVLKQMGLKRFSEARQEDYKPVFMMLQSAGYDIDTYHYRTE